MHIPVKIKHDTRKCRICEEMAQTCNAVPSCGDCEMQSGVWVDTVKSIFETLAVVVLDTGEVVNIPVSRIANANVNIGEVSEWIG